MFRGILERFEAAVVDGELDGTRMAAQALVRDAHGDGGGLNSRAKRGGEAVLGEHLRVDAARDALELVECLVELSLELLDDRLLLRRELLAREAEMHPQGDEPLLRGVVQIASDPAPLRIRGGERASLGGAQLPLEPAGLDREQGCHPGRVDELGILRKRLVCVERRHRDAVACDLLPLPSGNLGRVRELSAVGVTELPSVRVPVAESQ